MESTQSHMEPILGELRVILVFTPGDNILIMKKKSKAKNNMKCQKCFLIL